MCLLVVSAAQISRNIDYFLPLVAYIVLCTPVRELVHREDISRSVPAQFFQVLCLKDMVSLAKFWDAIRSNGSRLYCSVGFLDAPEVNNLKFFSCMVLGGGDCWVDCCP